MPDERKIVKYSVRHLRFKGVRGRFRPPVDKSEFGKNICIRFEIDCDNVLKLIEKLEQL
jgi:hypothetical protein